MKLIKNIYLKYKTKVININRKTKTDNPARSVGKHSSNYIPSIIKDSKTRKKVLFINNWVITLKKEQ